MQFASAARDIFILLCLALGLFTALAVYWPGSARSAGEYVSGTLYAALGAGAYLVPIVLLLFAGALLRTSLKPRFIKAVSWVAGLTLLASLGGGLFSETAGGILGQASARLGHRLTGGFYPVLLTLIALIVVLRLAGRSVLAPIARGIHSVAMQTGSAVAAYRKSRAKEAKARAGQKRHSKKDRAVKDEQGRKRREEVLAAEVAAADAPEGESPLVHEIEAGRSAERTAGTLSAAVHSGHAQVMTQPRSTGTAEPYDDFTRVVDAAGGGAPDKVHAPGSARASPAAGELPAQSNGEAGANGSPSEDEHGASGDGQLSLFSSTLSGYELPPIALLRGAPRAAGEEQHLAPRARIIERTLKSFNLDTSCVNQVVGPRVTRYELRIGPGINVSKIHNLADNLALELAVKAVRIEAPVPGLSAVGIEVPNAIPQLVTLRDILESSANQSSNHPLTVGLGRDIAGNPIVANIAKMPHLLVAGATGSGKSVCLNAMIAALLMRNAPDTLRLILIDPKRVELTCYSDIPHLACPVVHDVSEAQSALKWTVAEMERRYRLLEKRRARNIAAYNEAVSQEEQLPFIVIVVDELADLMMLAGQVFEKLVCRIAQLSRAVGIHLIIATQRPDVKVITGTIKANIPSRVAFAVVSQIDSRTILDSTGAEKLMGSGDMLFSPIGENVPIRVQGCFVSDEEIDRVVEWVKGQAGARYDLSITRFDLDAEGGDVLLDAYGKPLLDAQGNPLPAGESARDEFFSPARDLVQQTGRASTSFLQRRLKIGYNRAARVMEELEEASVVSSPDHAGNRKVL